MMTPSNRTLVGLLLILAGLMTAGLFVPAQPLPAQPLPAPADGGDMTMPLRLLINVGLGLLVIGGLGYLGYRLSLRLGFPEVWDAAVTNRQRFFVPLVVGLLLGCVMVAADVVLAPLHGLGPLPHPEFPASIIASAAASIGEEALFRLFFIPFWMWLISLPLRGRHRDAVFWVVTILSAVAFGAGHLPAAPLVLGVESVGEIPAILIAEIFVLNGAISIAAAYCFRKYGFLAAVGVHFWNNAVWHVLWGGLSASGS